MTSADKPSRVFVDSSAFLSLEDPDEAAHGATRRAVRDLIGEGARFVTTNFVFDETYTLILVRLGRRRAVAWGTSFKAGELVELVRVDEEHEAGAWQILVRFDDKDFSYTDATSFAVSESLGITRALSLDRHFGEYGRLEVLP